LGGPIFYIYTCLTVRCLYVIYLVSIESVRLPRTRRGRLQTGRRRTIWPNLVWGIPLVALLIVGYLGVKALFNRGEVVTVTFLTYNAASALTSIHLAVEDRPVLAERMIDNKQTS
jgi:hypothetical protein